MNKKIILFATLLAFILMNACEDVYDHVAAPPQANEQETEQSVSGFNFAKAWDGNEFGFGQATVNANGTADPGASDSGGNIGVGNPGWYIVVVTTAINGRDYEFAVDFYPPHVHLQGNVAGGNWGTTDEAYRFTVPALTLGADASFVSPPFTNTGEVRASIQLPGHEWWHTEFIVLDGVFAPRGAGDDQERVTGNAGQKLHINFTTNTGKVE